MMGLQIEGGESILEPISCMRADLGQQKGDADLRGLAGYGHVTYSALIVNPVNYLGADRPVGTPNRFSRFAGEY